MVFKVHNLVVKTAPKKTQRELGTLN